jgi:hypothetical protein
MEKQMIITYLESINPAHIHGKNLLRKLKDKPGDYDLLKKIFLKYKAWKEGSEKLCTNIENNTEDKIKELTRLFNDYKEFVTAENIYTAQSKFEPTILEEFMAVLFKHLVNDDVYSLGGIRAYSNLYFSPKDFNDFKSNPSIKINEKDQDFAIYRKVTINCENGDYHLYVPVLSMECKTYLDKTMLEGSIATAEKIKMGNPHCLFLIVTESYDVDIKVDPSYSRIDRIFVLRKQRGSEKKKVLNPIQSDVVLSLYNMVKSHLSASWMDVEKNITERGIVF